MIIEAGQTPQRSQDRRAVGRPISDRRRDQFDSAACLPDPHE